ncbi:MAG: TonB-dependent receptor [Burkholderiaceae bacterium]
MIEGFMPARCLPALLAIGLSAPSGLLAQSNVESDVESDNDLDPIVVTATRSPQATVNLVSDVESSTTAALRDRGALSVGDGLSMMPGITLTTNGGPASTSAILLRGASAGQTLTLVDGFRMSSVSLGQPTYEALPLMLTDRIEVLRGPGSAYYGADALGGVIQMFSPRPRTGRHFDAELAAGSQATYRLLGGVSGGSGGLSASLRVSRERSDGYNVTRPDYFAFNADSDGYQRNGVVANLSADLSSSTGLRLVFLRNELDTEYDDGVFADARTLTTTRLMGLTVEHVMADATVIELKLGQSKDRSESISSFPGVYESTQQQFAVSARKSLTETTELSVLYERLEQDVDAGAYAPNGAQTRLSNAVGMAVAGRAGAHILQASIRRDNSNQYGGQTNGTLTYGYVLSRASKLGSSIATGFRAPGFNDLYFPGYGRPNIKPERSRNIELGYYLDQRTQEKPGAWFGKLVAYSNSVRDLIVYAPICPDPDPQFSFGCADNVNRARLSGVSIQAGRRLGALSWRVNADFTNSIDRTLGKVLPRRAKRQLKVSVDYRVGQWLLGADLLGVSSRFDDAGNLVRLGGYGLIGVNIRRQFAAGWTGFLTVTNATDKDYTTAGGFASQGRFAMLGLRYQPK